MNRRDFIISAAGGAGWVVLAASGNARDPQNAGRRLRVHGRVLHRDTRAPLAGVAVSNGFVFALSDAGGAYALEVDVTAYPFVFVNPPSGLRAAAAHYHRVRSHAATAMEVDFELAHDPAQRRGGLRIAHVSDSHIGVASRPHFASGEQLAEDYRAIVAAESPDLILNAGDVTDAGRAEDFEACLAAGRAAGVPVIHTYGNHDSDADRADVGGRIEETNNLRYQAVIGPDQFTFDWGDYHVIVCGMYWPGMGFRRPRMSAWFSAALALQPAEKKIIVLTHDKPRAFPELTACWAPTLPELEAHPGVFLALHGHHHSTCVFRHGRLTVVGVPPVCFGGIDTSPRGYAVLSLDGPRVDVELRQLGGKPAPRHPGAARAPALPGASLRWVAQLPTNLHRAAPVVAADRVLVSLGDNRPLTQAGVVALDRGTGEPRWTCRTESAVKNSVGLAEPEGGVLRESAFAVEVTGRVHRLDLATGRRVWEQTLPYHPDRYLYMTPRATEAGIYVIQHKASYALAPDDGRILWRKGPEWEDNRSAVYQRPGLDATKLFYLTTTFMGLHALSAQDRLTGEILWMRRMDKLPAGYPDRFFQGHFPSPIVAGDFVVAPGLADRLAVFHRESGETVWQEPVLNHDGPFSGVRPAWYDTLYEHANGLSVGVDTIYAATSNGCAYALDLATGRRHWRFTTTRAPLLDFQPYHRGRGNLLTAPALWRDRVFLGGADGWLYILGAGDGLLRAELDFGSPITCPPVLDGDDLFVATFDGRCTRYALANPV